MNINKEISHSTAQVYVDEGLRQYMLRVYNYMTGGLTVTALAAFIVMNSPALISLFFNISPAGNIIGMSTLGWLMLFAPLIMVFAFGWVIARGTTKQVQATFWGFAAIMGISLSPTLLIYTGASVTRVFLITAAMFGGMSLYGYTTRRDLTSMGAFLRMGVWGLIIAMIINLFMQSSGMQYVLSFLSVLIFTGLTAYDTQTIQRIYSEGDSSDTATKKAVSGALSLYMDFINIFISLLNILGDRR